jgi:uncharacterized membrane protein
MYARILKATRWGSLSLLCFLTFTAVSFAKNTASDVKLYTPFSEISVPPGQTISYAIQVINNSDSIQTVDLALEGFPRHWTYTLRSSTWDITRVSVLPKKSQEIYFRVMVPLKVNKGSYHFELKAKGFTILPLIVNVTQEGTYKTEFTTTQANLEGSSTSTFTFNAKLKNATADTQLYALNAEPPPGWTATLKANYKEVASVNVPANQTQNITIEVKPPDQVPAGTYKIPVIASTNSMSAGLELEVVVTGSYSVNLTTPSGLLSTDITAGGEKQIELEVQNTGSAPLKNVAMNYKAPTNWDVSFDPKQIDMIPAGGSSQVTATIKAYKNSIAGDYAVDITAQTPQAYSKTEFRVTVKTPLLWGWIGIAVILIALGSVYYLFRKYGRR